MDDDAKPPLQEDFLGASPVIQHNPLIPDLHTTPPPGNPMNEFGFGTTPDSYPLHPGQTLIVYHPFAEHPPEIINTANLTWTQEPNILQPSEEPWSPFKTRADFEQAELFLHHNCTDSMVNDQLHLNQTVSPVVQTMKNAHEMHKILADTGQYQDTSSVGLLFYCDVPMWLTWMFSLGIWKYLSHIPMG